MPVLYNCKHSGDQYRITKFDDGEPKGSYLTTFEECDCPAGKRPMCRHREMLPKFLQRGAVNTGWFFDYDRGGWVDNRTQEELDLSAEAHDGIEWLKENGHLSLTAPSAAKPRRKPDGRRL